MDKYQERPTNEFLDYWEMVRVEDRAARYSLENYEHRVEESFPYIPMDNSLAIFNLVRWLKKNFHVRPSILDVGAGTGRMVRIFRDMGFLATGIEFYSPYVLAGRVAHKLSDQELLVADAFELTSEFLASFDVIYTYMPLSNPHRMTELSFQLFSRVASKTFFVEMLPMYHPMSLATRDEYPFAFFNKSNRYCW